jgi:phosphatidylserine decarboxylase
MNKKYTQRTRHNNSMPVAMEGIPFILISLVITNIFYFSGFINTSFIFMLITLFIIYFFRDPEREKVVSDNEIISPADGKILGIWNLDPEKSPLGESAIKISIFMSVFNVHVNRAPISGKITDVKYNPGRFVSANLDKASEENENNRITLLTEGGEKIAFTQIAGLIARRIVCRIKTGDHVDTGQRIGLIRFGSRVDVFLPARSDIKVTPGEKVKAGLTTLGYLK